MRDLKIEGGTKEQRKYIENFLDNKNFEEEMNKIVFEVMAYDVPFKQTDAYKNLIKKWKIGG